MGARRLVVETGTGSTGAVLACMEWTGVAGV
jgi:hypothetical protein